MASLHKLTGVARITGRMVAVTGLHIGAGKDTVDIGGIDLPVIRHPHSREPYVPGSSLKGKLRFMLEWAFGKVRNDGRAWGFNASGGGQRLDSEDPILRIFGSSIPRRDWEAQRQPDPGPTRLVVRDAFLDPDWVKEVETKGLQLTEEKMEVSIDRIAGKALDGGLRRTERVVAGARFDIELSFRLYDTGDGGKRDRECLNWLLGGLGLLEQDALGGSGSRGYGRVSFENLRVALPDGTEQEIGSKHRLNRFPVDRAPEIVRFAA
ncbi:MAG: type III-A CRISPR-associated RAMP protein Csm3 [Geminicoccaceae bacterium]|nr:type III-A CRISPR-associated RAMP protein Csm3 [Geminicoccaceae bacterium]MDW8371974.1 type III-A CRISPR-associated RAMP protein Csm3 [Geminicoccaceae bacterium]